MATLEKQLRKNILDLVRAQREICHIRLGIGDTEREFISQADVHLDTAIDTLFEVLEMCELKEKKA